MSCIRAVEGGVRLAVHVQPRARRTEVGGRYGDAIKIRVAAPPVEGAANRALAAFVAETLGVSQSAVRIISGGGGRSKVLEVQGVTVETARARLGERE